MNTIAPVQLARVPQFQGKASPSSPASKIAHSTDTVQFSGNQPQFGSGKQVLLSAAGILAALMGMGTLGSVRVVSPTETCAITNKLSGDIRRAESGTAFVPIIVSNMTCFTTASTRVTEDPVVRSVEQVNVKVPVSLSWAPNPAEIDKVYREVYGPGGTNDPTLKPSFDQISDAENRVLWENAMYSEFRGMIEEVTSLVPASQLNTVAFKEVMADAIMNGYNPQEVYDTFAPYQMRLTDTSNTPENGQLEQLVQQERRPSLQERITERYGAEVILISAATVRDTSIEDPTYRAALERLGQYPTLIREQEQQIELNRATGEANAAQALAQRTVDETNAETRRIVSQKDAETAATVTITRANADAEANRIINDSLEGSDALIRYLYAQGFQIAAENGNLIITDAQGNQANILVNPNR